MLRRRSFGKRPGGWRRLRWVLWWLAVLCSHRRRFVAANGKGPTGLWAAPNGRHLLVADSFLPGLLLVDMVEGETVERIPLTSTFAKVSPTAVASCGDCTVVFLSLSGGKYLLWRFGHTVNYLLHHYGRLGLANSTVERYHSHGTLASDGRSVVMSDDGTTVYLADFRGNAIYAIHGLHLPPSRKVASFDLSRGEGNLQLVKLPQVDRRMESPYGISKAETKGLLWVTTHGGILWKINATTGQTRQMVNMTAINCSFPDLVPIFRNAVPVFQLDQKDATLLVLGNYRHARDSSLWRVSVDDDDDDDKNHVCQVWLGGRLSKTDSSVGLWRDGWGSTKDAVLFSQPHNLVLRPNASSPTVILTDIHNRALRLVDLSSTGTTWSILYDRDRQLQRETRNLFPCPRDTVVTTFSLPLQGAASVISIDATKPPMTWQEAHDSCHAQGMRLCEPFEFQRAVSSFPTLFSPNSSSSWWWTNAPCAGCYEDKAGNDDDNCETLLLHHLAALEPGGNQTVFRQALVEAGFQESWLPVFFWNGGNAIQDVSNSRTMCLGNNDLAAHVACCDDCLVTTTRRHDDKPPKKRIVEKDLWQ